MPQVETVLKRIVQTYLLTLNKYDTSPCFAKEPYDAAVQLHPYLGIRSLYICNSLSHSSREKSLQIYD